MAHFISFTNDFKLVLFRLLFARSHNKRKSLPTPLSSVCVNSFSTTVLCFTSTLQCLSIYYFFSTSTCTMLVTYAHITVLLLVLIQLYCTVLYFTVLYLYVLPGENQKKMFDPDALLALGRGQCTVAVG